MRLLRAREKIELHSIHVMTSRNLDETAVVDNTVIVNAFFNVF